jgi:hypothetical protein
MAETAPRRDEELVPLTPADATSIENTLRSIQFGRNFDDQAAHDLNELYNNSPDPDEPIKEIMARIGCDVATLAIRGVSEVFGLANRIIPGRSKND